MAVIHCLSIVISDVAVRLSQLPLDCESVHVTIQRCSILILTLQHYKIDEHTDYALFSKGDVYFLCPT